MTVEHRGMADRHSEIKTYVTAEREQSGLQRQTAQATVNHRGHPVTKLHTVASRSTGQTGGCL